MNITLPQELENRVREKIQRGDYDNADALVKEAVDRLIEEDETGFESLRKRLRQADAEIDLAQDIHARGMTRLGAVAKTRPWLKFLR